MTTIAKRLNQKSNAYLRHYFIPTIVRLTIKNARLLTHSLMTALFVLYLINKFIWRNHIHDSLFFTVFKGSLPNLVAAILLPLIFIEGLLKVKTFRELKKNTAFCCLIILIVLGILILEEFYPFFFSSKVFDYWDILFSIMGAGLAFIYLNFIHKIVKKQISD